MTLFIRWTEEEASTSNMSNHFLKETLPAGTTIRTGVPAERPQAAIDALVRLFSEKDNVISACLGLMEIVHANESSEFTYTVGIQCSADESHTTEEALETLQRIPTGRWKIFIVPFTSEYFSPEAIVFFRKDMKNMKPTNWLSRLFWRK